MEGYCRAHGGEISGGWQQNYGYIVETEHYRYCLRCNPQPGDYQAYLTCFDLRVQRMNMENAAPVIARTSYASGEVFEHRSAEAFLKELKAADSTIQGTMERLKRSIAGLEPPARL